MPKEEKVSVHGEYLLQSPDGYYWVWWHGNKQAGDAPKLAGPFSDKMLNLKVIQVDNPIAFNPETDV